jgi:hypothetical protein
VIQIRRATGPQSIRIGFTDQRLTTHGGLAFWSAFRHKRRGRAQLQAVLPHAPTVRADTGFYHEEFLRACERRQLRSVVVARLDQKWPRYCRHDDAAWTPPSVPGQRSAFCIHVPPVRLQKVS